MQDCHANDLSKRILILANSDVGLYKFRKELLQKFIKNDYEVYIALPQGEFVSKLVELGCKFIEIPVERRGMNPLKDVKLIIKYIGVIKKHKPNAVLTYTIKPNIYGGIACQLTQTNYFVNITGLGTSVENPGILQKIIIFLYRIGVNGAKCTFFQNKSNMSFMMKHNVGSVNKVLLPGSGIDTFLHHYNEFPKNSKEIIFLSVMRIMRDKGIFELLDCAKKIKKKYAEVKFILVGDYDEDCRAQVEKSKEKGYIEYLGFRNDIDELMRKSHCIINPSYHEGMSNVLLEAAACGRPVIASNIPGCIETFDESVTGYGFEVRNTDDLIRCVEKFLSLSHKQMEEMGINGRKKIEREFNREIVIEKYMKELNKI